MAEIKMTIPHDKVNDVRMWFRERGGVILWKNQEIGVTRDDLMTPTTHEDGTPGQKPHWAYSSAGSLQPEEIQVSKKEYIEPPLEWFPLCQECKGSGRYPIAEIAKIHARTLEDTLTWLRENHGDTDPRESDMTRKCPRCQGTGHIDRSIRVRIKKHYWGIWISETGEKRARKLAAKIGEDVKWDWIGQGYGLASITFYREQITPFTLE